MKEDEMLMCLICFVLGYLVARMIRGNGLSVGVNSFHCPDKDYCPALKLCLGQGFVSQNHQACYGH